MSRLLPVYRSLLELTCDEAQERIFSKEVKKAIVSDVMENQYAHCLYKVDERWIGYSTTMSTRVLYTNTTQEEDEATEEQLPPILVQLLHVPISSDFIRTHVIPDALSVYDLLGAEDLTVVIICKNGYGSKDRVLAANCYANDTHRFFQKELHCKFWAKHCLIREIQF